MAEDYRIQTIATKATWVGDKAYYELTARISTRRKGVPFPDGEFIVFDPGGHRKQIDSRGIAFIRLSTDRQGVFTTIASLESDPNVHDEIEVVVPEKQKEEKLKPKKLSVVFYGPNGSQTLVISVSGETGLLIPKFKGNIITDLEGVNPFETKDDGIAKYQLKHSEDDRSVEIQAGDTKELAWRGLLLGGDSKQMVLPETI